MTLWRRIWDACDRLHEHLQPIIRKLIDLATAHFRETVLIGIFLLAFLLYEITGWMLFGIPLLITAFCIIPMLLQINSHRPAAQRLMGIRRDIKKQRRQTASYMVIHLFSDDPDPEGEGLKQVEQVEMDDRADFADQIPVRLRQDFRYVHQFLIVGEESLYVAGYENTNYDKLAGHRREDEDD